MARAGGLTTAPVITLTTDFGTSDAYVGAMKGVILGINPDAVIIDLTHSIEPQNIGQAAFVFSTAYTYFPDGTIHLVVVDPGVGTRRKIVVLASPRAFFVAPDNGVLSYVVQAHSRRKTQPQRGFPTEGTRKKLPPPLKAFAITNPRYWHHPVSQTFHGRDILAPVAAHLSLGVSPQEFGDNLSHLLAFPVPRPYAEASGEVIGHVVHVDRFGNLITDVTREDLASQDVSIEVAGRDIRGLSSSYEEAGELLAIFGSSGYLEVAARSKSAATLLGLKVGDVIRISGNT